MQMLMAADSFQILPATAQDLPDIAALAGIIWGAIYPGIISREQIEYMLGQMYSQEVLQADMQARSVSFARLVNGGRMVGFAAWGPTSEAATFMLHKLYLLPEMHGQGLGSRLLRHCESHAATRRATRLKLRVNKRNARAIEVYQRNGYTVCDSICTPIGGGFFMDDFVMSKLLRPGE